MEGRTKKASVTGANGFMASLLIKHLLNRDYSVNATVRCPENSAKVAHLKDLQGLGELQLFQADLSQDGSFDAAVAGCNYVFLIASPVNAMSDDPENELIKPAKQGILNVMKSCAKAKTVKRIVLISSGASVSINKSKGTGLVLDEQWWSDIDFLTTEKPPSWGYPVSKTLAEKEAWRFAQENDMDLVTIIPSLMLGTPLTMDAPQSIKWVIGLLSGNELDIGAFRTMQEVSGSISLVHVDDVCRAHIFAAETESASGRYICCAINTSLPELAQFLSKRYPQYNVPTDFGESLKKAKLSLSSEKLVNAGFKFKKPNLEEIIDEAVEYGKAAGMLPK